MLDVDDVAAQAADHLGHLGQHSRPVGHLDGNADQAARSSEGA